MNKVGIGIVILGWLLSLSTQAQEVGWINQFDGQASDYLLQREDKTFPVTLLMLLKVGDKISVNDKQHSIELNLQGGIQSVKVTYENSPFLIQASHQAPAELSGLWKWTTERVDEWHQLLMAQAEQLEQSKTRGESKSTGPIMPLISNVKPDETLQSARLVAGKRPLHLQWQGGTPPYRVIIKQRLDELLTLTTDKTEITTEAINFEGDKSYHVKIIDANNLSFTGGFRVVSPENLPTYPESLPVNRLPPIVYQTLQAIWLATQKDPKVEATLVDKETPAQETQPDGSKWIFEAYQQAAALASQYLPAQLLQQALAQGAKLKVRGIRG